MGYTRCVCNVVYDNSMSSCCPSCDSIRLTSFRCACGSHFWGIGENERGVDEVYCIMCEHSPWQLSFCSTCRVIKGRGALMKKPGTIKWGREQSCQDCAAAWYKKTLSVIYEQCDDDEILSNNRDESQTIIENHNIDKCTCNNILKRVVVKMVTRVKIDVVVVWCTSCGRKTRTLPYSKLGELDKRYVPSISDYAIEGINICGVNGCNENGAAEHHYAPSHIFGEAASDWPIGYLCREHHSEWHKKTKTGIYRKQ